MFVCFSFFLKKKKKIECEVLLHYFVKFYLKDGTFVCYSMFRLFFHFLKLTPTFMFLLFICILIPPSFIFQARSRKWKPCYFYEFLFYCVNWFCYHCQVWNCQAKYRIKVSPPPPPKWIISPIYFMLSYLNLFYFFPLLQWSTYFRDYFVLVVMFFASNVCNNYAFNFNIPMPLHMIFRAVSNNTKIL